MRVIDLLNKISRGEEVPEKIKYDDEIYIHCGNYCYFCEETNEILSQNIYAEFSRLNDEVEIIEEDKKDKEIELYVNGEKVDITDIYEPLKQGEYFYKENDKWYVHKLKNVSFVIEEDKKIEKLDYVFDVQSPTYNESWLMTCIKANKDKINEIIDVINKGDK